MKKSLSEGDPIIGVGTLMASPIYSDHENTNQPQQEAKMDFADPVGTEDFLHSTPELVPPKNSNNQQRPSRKKAQQQPRTKPEPAPQKVERGRKPDRAPLKKPWENPKPKARSKSRDRSATRAQTAMLSQGNKLNSSLGFNDTFDFDCEEAVHVTPFRAKAKDNQSTLLSEETPQPEATPMLSIQIESSSSSTASESEDSLYVPQKSRRPQTSPDLTKGITTRRGRHSKVVREKEIIPPKQEICGELLGLLSVNEYLFIRVGYG